MKRYFNHRLKINIPGITGLCLLALVFGPGMLGLTGCKKDRLFTHVDSIAAVPSQFHFFNSFSYDTALELTIDGLPREAVEMFGLSKYYSTSSAFNLNQQQPNSKLINVYDPANSSLFANSPTANTFQFRPNTSYVVWLTNNAYDTVRAPLKTTVPVINYYPEDIYHPFDGTTGIRFFNSIATTGSPSASLSITPNIGSGTTATLNPVNTISQPTNPATTYSITQYGSKKISMLVTGRYQVQFNFLPVQLNDGTNYSFFGVGDITNYLAGIQPRPRLFMVQDGAPQTLKELTLSSITYPANISSQSAVTLIDNAYNVSQLLTFGTVLQYTQYKGLDVHFNQTVTNIARWPILAPDGGGPYFEDVHDSVSLYKGIGPANILTNRVKTLTLTPNTYQVSVTPGSAFSPSYDSFSYNFQQGLSYSVILMPLNTTSQSCTQLVLQNDQSPSNTTFKLRLVNIMGGSMAVDVHTGSPSGPIIFSSVGYGQATDYLSFAPNLAAQSLYVTAAGSTIALFQTGKKNTPLSLAFKPGNSGTIFLMGLLPGTAYAGDSSYFGPYAFYNSDAYVDPNNRITTSQLFY